MTQTSSYNLFRVIKEKYNFLIEDLEREKAVKATQIEAAKTELDKDLELLYDEMLNMKVLGERSTHDEMVIFYEKLLSIHKNYNDELQSYITKLFESRERKVTRKQLDGTEISTPDLLEPTEGLSEEPTDMLEETPQLPSPEPINQPQGGERKLIKVELEEAIKRIWVALPMGKRTSTTIWRKLLNSNIKVSEMTVWRYMKRLNLQTDGKFMPKHKKKEELSQVT